MNILILQQTMNLGGVNVVSAYLAAKFQKEGHLVDVFAFYADRNDMPIDNYQGIPIYIGNGFSSNQENVNLLKEIFKKHSTNLVINMWGLPYAPTATLRKACKGTKVRWISYYHSDPLFNGRIHSLNIAYLQSTNIIKKIGLWGALKTMTFITSRMMRLNYHYCWRYMVLSDSYVNNFKKFTGLKQAEKLRVMTNPVTIDSEKFKLEPELKKKEVIFVGRLDPTNKKVSRLIEAWSIVEKSCPEWTFTIVGDGPEKETLLHRINELQLEKVKLVGNQDPRPFYERASLLVLSSDFEGFPLVLGECMSFGVVPVIYDSFSALHDIVENKKNGIIIPKKNGEYSASLMADGIIKIINTNELRQSMMEMALQKSKDFHIDKIYQNWLIIFKDFENEN